MYTLHTHDRVEKWFDRYENRELGKSAARVIKQLVKQPDPAIEIQFSMEPLGKPLMGYYSARLPDVKGHWRLIYRFNRETSSLFVLMIEKHGKSRVDVYQGKAARLAEKGELG